MALVIGDNFSFQGAKPLDGRLKYDTLANMKAVGDSTMYEGCLAYCVATDKTYQWKSTNTVDADLGKWREFSSGGGGGHAIEDSEGTALTQRETMQFGDGFNATDDSENEKTVVEPNLMTAADMDDVVTPLPSVRSRYHKYSTEEQIVGEWIDGKPLYQKTIVDTMPEATTLGTIVAKDISVNANVDKFIDIKIMIKSVDSSNEYYIPLSNHDTVILSSGEFKEVFRTLGTNNNSVEARKNKISIRNGLPGWSGTPVYITIQYTKTTD